MSYYKCAMCKDEKGGPPARSNAAGKFCKECSDEITRRSRMIAESKRDATGGNCAWCGVVFESCGVKKRGTTCPACETKRDWLLRSIRYSDKAAKYVERVEAREKPAREARKIKRKTASKTSPALPESTKINYELLAKFVVEALKKGEQ